MKSNMRFSDNNNMGPIPTLLDIAKSYGGTIILTLAVIGAFCLFSGCKKSTKVPEPEPIVQPSTPKGNMEGEWVWFAGDTAVSNLVVTTQCLSCNDPAIPYSIDYYTTNHYITPYDQPNHYKVKADFKSDTIEFAYKGHIYDFYRKK